MVTDVVVETQKRIAAAQPRDADAVRNLGRPLVAFSPAMEAANRGLKDFLFRHMYRHERVNRMTANARRVVRALFECYREDANLLPAEWRRQAENRDEPGRMRVIADYIAGMTDRYALQEHARLTGETLAVPI